MSRVATGLLLAIIAAGLVLAAPPWLFLTAATYMGVVCYWEYAGLVAGHGIARPGVFGFLAGVLILFWPEYVLPGFSLLAILALGTALRHVDLRGVLPQVACAFLGALYTFAPWRFAVLIRARGVHWLLFALALNWAGDSLAYYTGRAFGRHKLAPVISPQKTWEGAAGSMIGSVVFGIIYLGFFESGVPWYRAMFIAAVANIAGQVGDLAESAMKRGAGVKDSGNMLPGHGGILDRVDSSLFALPVVYILVFILG